MLPSRSNTAIAASDFAKIFVVDARKLNEEPSILSTSIHALLTIIKVDYQSCLLLKAFFVTVPTIFDKPMPCQPPVQERGKTFAPLLSFVIVSNLG